MKKIKVVFLTLLLFTVITANSQEGQTESRRRGEGRTRSLPRSEAESPEKISIYIKNETGYTIKAVFICKAGENNWGDNLLENLLREGDRTTAISIDPFDSESKYDIHVQDVDGDFYTRRNIELKRSLVITIKEIKMIDGHFEF
jgi:hypothetical protein